MEHRQHFRQKPQSSILHNPGIHEHSRCYDDVKLNCQQPRSMDRDYIKEWLGQTNQSLNPTEGIGRNFRLEHPPKDPIYQTVPDYYLGRDGVESARPSEASDRCHRRHPLDRTSKHHSRSGMVVNARPQELFYDKASQLYDELEASTPPLVPSRKDYRTHELRQNTYGYAERKRRSRSLSHSGTVYSGYGGAADYMPLLPRPSRSYPYLTELANNREYLRRRTNMPAIARDSRVIENLDTIHNKRHVSINASSPPMYINFETSAYGRRARHKTRPDRYDLKKRPRHERIPEEAPKPKRTKHAHSASKEVSNTMPIEPFAKSQYIHSSRITVCTQRASYD